MRGRQKISSPRLALRARVALQAKYRVRPAWLINACHAGYQHPVSPEGLVGTNETTKQI